jgi:hypothetical protein
MDSNSPNLVFLEWECHPLAWDEGSAMLFEVDADGTLFPVPASWHAPEIRANAAEISRESALRMACA